MYLIRYGGYYFAEEPEAHPIVVVSGLLLMAFIFYQYIKVQKKLKNKAPK